jgi:hypothetical protein
MLGVLTYLYFRSERSASVVYLHQLSIALLLLGCSTGRIMKSVSILIKNATDLSDIGLPYLRISRLSIEPLWRVSFAQC